MSLQTIQSSTVVDSFAADHKLSDENINQYLTFFLAGEEYGVDILSVQEIRGWEKTTVIPNSPDYVKGVINLRGTIVPIVDLRLRFALPVLEYGPLTVVIVLMVKDKTGRNKVVGIVVDAVSDVYDIDHLKVKNPPDLEYSVGNTYISGLYNVENKMVILLDINTLLIKATSLNVVDVEN